MREVYRSDLQSVTEELVGIGRLVEVAVTKANHALFAPDLRLAEEVITADQHVDSAQVELDEKIVELLARQSPVASDLRLLVGALRMSSSLERMGDLAAHVAVVARARYPESAVPEAHREDLGTLSELAREAITDTIEVIADRDLARGALVERRDEELDELHSAIYRAVARTEGYSAAQVMDLTLLPRFYERFGDHAVSVVRRVGFLVTGDSLDSRESVGDDF